MPLPSPMPHRRSRRLRLRAALCLCAAIVAAPAAADPSPSWVGTWRLDPERSDGPDEMMELLEYSWLLRVAGRRFRPNMQISIRDGALHVDSPTPFGGRERFLAGDGATHTGEEPVTNRPYRERGRWQDQGTAIALEREVDLPSGRVAHMRIRWRVDGDLLFQTSQVRVGEEERRMRRVFERLDSGP